MTIKARPVLDDISRAIIEQLQIDGRKPYAAIGIAVGLSEAAVRQRIAKLIESGVMQVVAVTDPLTVGSFRMAMIGIKVEGDLVEVADQLSAADPAAVLARVEGGQLPRRRRDGSAGWERRSAVRTGNPRAASG